MYKYIIRPFLFLFPPEMVHGIVTYKLRILNHLPFIGYFLRKFFCLNEPKNKTTVFGIDFPNPVGLAAGFDKDAESFNELSNFGFGFIEIGTVTPLAQEGNPKPRLFRLKKDQALLNRMGFNNKGAAAIAARLKGRRKNIVLGVNIGKNKITPNENAINDYEICFRTLFDCADYFVVNVSSPNTPGLRELQEKEPLKKILFRLKEINSEISETRACKGKPILLKIAPDLSDQQLDDIVEIVMETKIEGVIATNTTISRKELQTPGFNNQAGGVSGKPLTKRSTQVIKYISEKSKKSFPIIGVGGIHSPEDALEKLQAGASLVQLYTGFIYEGPELVKRILKKLK